MALATKFEIELQRLFYRRTSWLRKAIGKNRPGRPHVFNRKKVEPKLYELGELATQILVKRRARREFRRAIDGKRQWHVKRGKGFGIDAKQRKFKRWYEKHIGGKNCVLRILVEQGMRIRWSDIARKRQARWVVRQSLVSARQTH